ncbi:MAG: DUF488 domain-containing protein [Cyanobacteriota bacterium]|nr:DUF488 domain-containing protein [Cyanobacteriota bacterium]
MDDDLLSQKVIFTFGYGNRTSYSQLGSYFLQYDLKYLIDVRLSPKAWSRIWYRDEVENFCKSIGVKYISATALGNTTKTNKWVPPDLKNADLILREISKIVETDNVVLLCAELDPSRCHRVQVANELCMISNASVKNLV